MSVTAREGTDGVRPLAEAIGIGKRFGPTVALAEARITVRAGESHALVGRNGAGKSTLVSILTGLYPPDQGEVRFDGAPAPGPQDRDGWRSKVACVYQKSTIIPELTVAENVFMNRQPGRRGLISWSRMRREAVELLETWGVSVDPDLRAGDLSVENRQLVEIARALSFGARFIILDEPTAQLDSSEIKRLFSRMRSLQESGVTFLFISHHLQEVYEVCQTVTVFRDARWVATSPVADLPKSELIEAMTGEPLTPDSPRQVVSETRRASTAQRSPRLEVAGMSGDRFQDVTLTVRQGEVVGLAGSSGSGKIELAETLVGFRRPSAGGAVLDGTPIPVGDVPKSLAAGIGTVPRDRHQQGLVPDLSVGENASLTITRRLGRYGFISPRQLRTASGKVIEDLGIVTQGPDQPVSALSGGNQQKVVMARALANDPRLLVLINPTAGVDVKSKEALLAIVDEVREQGTSVIIISDELDDLRPCDRVLVLFHGRVVAEYAAGWTDHDLVASIEGVSND